MKKTLVALAALAATSAFAQSSVTMYGNIDYATGTTKTTSTINDAGDIGTSVKKVFATNGTGALTNWSSNALGFKGTEDLGNGLKANFQIETGLKTTQADGQKAENIIYSSKNSARDTWAGLSGNFGEVRIGYQTTNEHDVVGMGEAGTTNLAGHLNGLDGSGRQLRHDMVNFISPTFGGGFTATVQWGKAKTTTETLAYSTAEDGTVESSSAYQALGLKFAQGPLTVAAGTRTVKQTAKATDGATYNPTIGNFAVGDMLGDFTDGGAAGDQLSATVKNKANYMGGQYDFGAYKLYASMVKHKITAEGTVDNAVIDPFQAKNTISQIGVNAPMGAFTPFFSVGRAKHHLSLDGQEYTSVKQKSYALGSTYALSKRTGLYAIYTNVKTTGTDVTPGANYVEETKVKQTLVGLRHQF